MSASVNDEGLCAFLKCHLFAFTFVSIYCPVSLGWSNIAHLNPKHLPAAAATAAPTVCVSCRKPPNIAVFALLPLPCNGGAWLSKKQ